MRNQNFTLNLLTLASRGSTRPWRWTGRGSKAASLTPRSS